MTIYTSPDIDCATLGELGLEPLRAIWRARFGAAPAIRSPEILALMLAWRIQAAREGGLDGELRRRCCQSNANLSPPGAVRAGA